MVGAKTLPLIEFSKENMERGTTGWASTMQAVRMALEVYGCFEAVYKEIEPNANNDLLRTLEKFFNLELKIKQCFTSDVPFEGYDRFEDPPNEVMGIYNALASTIIESFVRNLFPQGNVQICETIHLYVTKVWELEKVVRRMVFESFGVEGLFEEQQKSIQYHLRLMKYGVGTTKESRGKPLRPHYDKDFLTILHDYGVNGLQVKARDSNQWIRPTLSGSSFLVMAGESFHGWSNGRIQCALHRVKISEDGDEEESKAIIRYSVGLFSVQIGTVKTPNELVDENHPMLFKPFNRSSLIEATLKNTHTFQDYNGDNINLALEEHYAI